MAAETYTLTGGNMTVNLRDFASALEPHLNCMIDDEYLDSIGLVDDTRLNRAIGEVKNTFERELRMEVEQQIEENFESVFKAHIDCGNIVTVGMAEEIAVNMARDHLDDIDWGSVVSDNLDVYWMCEEVENHLDYSRVASEVMPELDVRELIQEELDADYVLLNNFDRTTSLMQNEILELKNQLEIARRSINVLLTDRERTLKYRVSRALVTLTDRIKRAWSKRPRLRITRGGN